MRCTGVLSSNLSGLPACPNPDPLAPVLSRFCTAALLLRPCSSAGISGIALPTAESSGRLPAGSLPRGICARIWAPAKPSFLLISLITCGYADASSLLVCACKRPPIYLGAISELPTLLWILGGQTNACMDMKRSCVRTRGSRHALGTSS